MPHLLNHYGAPRAFMGQQWPTGATRIPATHAAIPYLAAHPDPLLVILPDTATAPVTAPPPAAAPAPAKAPKAKRK